MERWISSHGWRFFAIQAIQETLRSSTGPDLNLSFQLRTSGVGTVIAFCVREDKDLKLEDSKMEEVRAAAYRSSSGAYQIGGNMPQEGEDMLQDAETRTAHPTEYLAIAWPYRVDHSMSMVYDASGTWPHVQTPDQIQRSIVLA